MSRPYIPPEFIIADSKQSRNIDSDTITKFGIDGFTLMEIAGSSTARHLLTKINRGGHGIFFCGKGNNAGDALVTARYLMHHQIKATLVFLSGTDDLSENALKNFLLVKKIVEKDPDNTQLNLIESWENFDLHAKADFLVDGMLGTGLNSELRNKYKNAVSWINENDIPTYSIDIPTGLNADTGQVMGKAVRATATFSYGVLKLGFYLNEGYRHTGEIYFCELPFPNYLKQNCSTFLIDNSWIKKQEQDLPKHKYDGGVLYILAGSKGLTGAAIMAAHSAWAEGLGAVILISPEGNLPIYEKNLPQIIKKEVGTAEDYHFKPDHLSKILNILREKKGTVLIGPGMGRAEETISFIQSFLEEFEGKTVIDADALFALAQMENWEKPSKSNWIITPHPGELSRLVNKKSITDPERIHLVKKMAQSKKINIVSKGFPVIVGTGNADTYLTSYDTRKFSRAGFGDILAGKISAYWSLGYSSFKSCALGLLNGKNKLDNLTEANKTHIPEPLDLI